jgi:hypothetical protein
MAKISLNSDPPSPQQTIQTAAAHRRRIERDRQVAHNHATQTVSDARAMPPSNRLVQQSRLNQDRPPNPERLTLFLARRSVKFAAGMLGSVGAMLCMSGVALPAGIVMVALSAIFLIASTRASIRCGSNLFLEILSSSLLVAAGFDVPMMIFGFAMLIIII